MCFRHNKETEEILTIKKTEEEETNRTPRSLVSIVVFHSGPSLASSEPATCNVSLEGSHFFFLSEQRITFPSDKHQV